MNYHKRFPFIAKVLLGAVTSNGGIHRTRTVEDVAELIDECLGAEGVYWEQLVSLDRWLGALGQEELDIVIDGEESEADAILAGAPNMGQESAKDFIYSAYQYCI